MKLLPLLTLPLILLSLSSCGIVKKPDQPVIVQKEYVKQNIILQAHPAPIEFPDTEWFVVNKDNLEESLKKIEETGGSVAFMAITPKGYENLSIGVAELRRYILQQKEIIAYYEKTIQGDQTAQSATGTTQ